MTATAAPTRVVRTRRIAFDHEHHPVPKHYMDDDLVMSHVVSVLSALFPEGEDFFVAAVRAHRDQITDPELKKQVAGFIGQEAIHGREHRELNERLDALGYPTKRIDRGTRVLLGLGEKVLPRSVQLAITAALEHYTATLAEVLLTDERAQAMVAAPEVRNLLLWHTLEESEHKAVAYDVYQHAVGDERTRTWVMHVTTGAFLALVAVETTVSLAFDRETYRRGRLRRSLARLPRSPWLSREVRRHIRDYHRRDFHPDDRDTTALVEEWRAALFGDDGALVDRLQSAS